MTDAQAGTEHGPDTQPTSLYDFELRYTDIRRAPGGVQFTFGPGPEGPIIIRLAYKTFIRLYNSALQGKRWNGPLGQAPNGSITGLVFMPPTDHDYGCLLLCNVVDGANGAPDTGVVLRWNANDEDWQELGQKFRDWYKKLPRPLDTEATEGWQPEEYHLCTECGRPVFDSAPTMMGPGRNSFLGIMCEPCGVAIMQEHEAADWSPAS
jgi:hypothetical protein